jgi:hypothetical protein
MPKKSTTFKGQPKPYGQSGHFHEPRRHSLQARGIKTGRNTQRSLTQFGIPEIPRTGIGDFTKEGMKKSEEKKERFADDMRTRTMRVGESLSEEIKGLNHPLIEDAMLDDFNKYGSSQMFVEIKADTYSDADGDVYCLIGGDNLADAQKYNLRRLTAPVRKVLKKFEKEGKITGVKVYPPKSKYKYDSILDKNEFVGYDECSIQIEYGVI